MKRSKLVVKLLRDIGGSVLVESTIIIPIFLLLALGTIDVVYMFSDWALANKAAYIGARRAIVSDPVAIGITTFTYTSAAGPYCFDQTTLAATGNCPSVPLTTCTGAASGGSCTNSYTFDDTAFTNAIFTPMQALFPRLQRQNVTVSYETNGLGFVGQTVQPGIMSGLPMNVTVSIKCMTHPFYFLSGLMNWFLAVPTGCPANTPKGWLIPKFASTLQSEDMDSSNN
jgi:Flp pilus assembly protein TadG